MSKSTVVTKSQLAHIAKLSHIPITKKETSSLADAMTETVEIVSSMQEIDVSSTQPTHQVTGKLNCTREDTETPDRTFSQSEATANAVKTHDGFFVVPRVLKKDYEE